MGLSGGQGLDEGLPHRLGDSVQDCRGGNEVAKNVMSDEAGCRGKDSLHSERLGYRAAFDRIQASVRPDGLIVLRISPTSPDQLEPARRRGTPIVLVHTDRYPSPVVEPLWFNTPAIC